MNRGFFRSLSSLTALATLLFGGFVGPACAQIDVSAPTNAQVRALGSWYEQHMPAKFRTKEAVDVSLMTGPEMTAYLRGGDSAPEGDSAASREDDGDIDGVFQNDPPRIALRLPSSDETDTFTFAHEYGHYVWFRLMSKADRKRYEAIYNRQRAARHLVTRYADTELEEGFAEAFSFFVNQPQLLAHRDSLSYAFLAQWTEIPSSRK